MDVLDEEFEQTLGPGGMLKTDMLWQKISLRNLGRKKILWCTFETLRPLVLVVKVGWSNDQGKGNRSHPQEQAGREGNRLLMDSTYWSPFNL